MAISSNYQNARYIAFVFAMSFTLSSCERISDRIYTNLQSDHYCGRRLNATHQMGCTSELGGNFGIVWIVESQDDIDHILVNGTTPPYVAAVGRNFYTRKNLHQFRDHPDRVSGVVFLDGDHEDSKLRTTPFSPDDTCPNRYSGLYVNNSRYEACKRNIWQKESQVSGLLYDDIPYPIFLINEKKSLDEIKKCFETNNIIPSQANGGTDKRTQAHYPLCALHLDSFMTAAKNSDSCLNSHFFIDELLQSNGRRCDTVDNYNIFAYYKPAYGPLQPSNGSNYYLPQVTPPQSIVMLITKLSSLSMFTEISPGADSTIVSIVTLLSVAEALGRVKNSSNVQNSTKNIAFAILDSEPFDYTGSNRMIFNMLNNTFPNGPLKHSKNNSDFMLNTNLASIEYIINLDQIAIYPDLDSIHFHSEPDERNTTKLQRIYEVMKKIASNEKVNLHREDPELPLPPTTVQEFIRYSREQNYRNENELTGLVLSNYGKTFNNLFYHSIYDDSHNVYQTSTGKLVEHIARVSKFLAKTMFEIAFATEQSENITVDKDVIEQLLQCYLIDADCHLFTRAAAAGQRLPTGPIETYKDPTKRSDDVNGVITAHLLAYFLGDKLKDYNLTKCAEDNQKSSIYNYEYVNGKDEPVTDSTSGLCIRSQVLMLRAQSPAFSYLDESNEISIDQKYPAWTVSFNGIRNPVRLYLKQSPEYQWATFILGVVITIASFLIVRHISESVTKMRPEVVSATLAIST